MWPLKSGNRLVAYEVVVVVAVGPVSAMPVDIRAVVATIRSAAEMRAITRAVRIVDFRPWPLFRFDVNECALDVAVSWSDVGFAPLGARLLNRCDLPGGRTRGNALRTSGETAGVCNLMHVSPGQRSLSPSCGRGLGQ